MRRRHWRIATACAGNGPDALRNSTHDADGSGATRQSRGMTIFDDAVALTPTAEHRFTARTHPAFANMVGPYGGVTAATMLNAVLQHAERIGDPLTLTVNFLGPIADGDWEVTAVPVRTNRTNQHWTITATQGDHTVMTGSAITGVERDEWSATDARPPAAQDPEQIEPSAAPFPFAWLRTCEMRFVRGILDPARPSESSETTVWLRQVPHRTWDHLGIASIADAFVPRILLRRGMRPVFGTITLTTSFHATAAELAEVDEFVLGEAVASRFHRGTYDQRGELWSRDGQLLATTTQLVYFKEPRA